MTDLLASLNITERSNILLPVVDGQVCNTFHVEPWMFKEEASPIVL